MASSPDFRLESGARPVSRRLNPGAALLALPFALLTACGCFAGELAGRWVDLTHAYSAETLYWPTAQGFKLRIDSRGLAAGGYWYEANSFESAEHGGTHLDAPVHFARGRHSVDQVPIERLIGPACVVDISEHALNDVDYQATVADIQAWERTEGVLPPGAIVILRTGHFRFWPDAQRYMGTMERGPEAVAKLHFPGLHPEAARWLVAEREVDALGIDTPSIDYGQSTEFKTHRILSEANIPVLENMANLDRLPVKGAEVIALPMKIKGGSGAPVRIVGLLPN